MGIKSQKSNSNQNNINSRIAHEHYRHYLKIKKEISFIVPWAYYDENDDIELQKKKIEKLNREQQSVRRAF